MDPAVIVDIAARAERVLAPVIAPSGYRLLLCEYVGGSRGRILRVYIERDDDTPVDAERLRFRDDVPEAALDALGPELAAVVHRVADDLDAALA